MNFIPERIDLPVFPSSVKVHKKSEYYAAAREPGRLTFVRGLYLGLDPLTKLGLVKIIETAGRERQRVAELCGALPIDATVGLYNTVNEDISPPLTDDSSKLVPKGYRLVAEVPVIKDFQVFLTDNPPADELANKAYQQTALGLTVYHDSIDGGDYYLSDMSIFQFGIDADNQTWLIDPDPIVKQQK